GRSCEDAVQTLIDYVVSQLDQKRKCLTVFLDLSKAFDCVNHNHLLKKLESFGFRSNFLCFLKSYLTGRKQCVRIMNTYSPFTEIDVGVPQGSVLGPLFFILYTNDMFSYCNNETNLISFADDTSITVSAQNVEDLFFRANTVVNNIYKWLCKNKLALNVNKTKYIHYSWYKSELLEKCYTVKIHQKCC